VAPERQLPPQRVRRTPMPDPTPDAPEPLPSPDEEPIVVDVIDDILFDVPDRAPEAAVPDPRYEKVLSVGGDVSMPVKVYAPEPVYPELARRVRAQGLVILQAVIDQEGRVVSAEIVRAPPMGLGEAALEAVRQWRYEPAMLHGRPVAVTFSLTVRFELH
jgi:protein TonB